MNKTILLLAIFICTPFLVLHAQYDDEESDHLSVGVGILSFLHPITPTINFHVEKLIRPSVTLDLAYGLDIPKSKIDFFIPFEVNDNGRHHIGKIAAKFFANDFSENKSRLNPYIGGEVFYVWNKYTRTSDFFETEGILYDYDSAIVTRNIRGARVKIGLLQSLWKLDIEVYFGIGAKQVNVKYQTMNQTPKSIGIFPIALSPFDGKEGRRLAPDFNGGIKISYRLSK